MASRRGCRVPGNIERHLWNRIMCAFVVHSALTLVVFAVVKMLSFRSLGVLVQPSQWVDVTLVHFRSFVWIIVSQSVPLFAFTLLGRSSRLAQWSPLRVDTAPSYGPPLHMYVVQVAANTMAALSFAVCLMESAGGSESLVAKADSGTNGTGGDTSIQLHWLHRYYIVCSALAAVACDTLRCFRNREHELVFPSMASESLPILERIPAFIADAALSAIKWLLFSWLFLQLIVPQAGYAILWAARQCLQNNLGGDTITDGTNSAESSNFVKFILGFSASKILLTAVVGPINWAVTVLKEFIDMDMPAITHMPAGVYWRATVTYGANYLLLSHGISVLKVLLTMPLDFLRAGAMVDARSSNQGDDVFIDDGPSVSQLLVQAMSYGWEKVREDAERPDFGDPQYAGDTYDSNYGFPSGPSSSEQLVMAHLGQDDYHQGFSGTRRRERFWVRLLDRQRRAVKRLAEGVAKRETTTMERIGGGSFSAAVRRAWTSLIHSYWAADGGVGGTVTMRAPIWNEQDVGISLFHQIVRALAFQHAAAMGWSGGRLRRDVLHHSWNHFLTACCLTIDSTALQLQTFLADRARYRDNIGSAKELFLGARATHANAKMDWIAATLMSDLCAAKIGFSDSNFDKILRHFLEMLAGWVPSFLKKVPGYMASPLPPPYPAPATQVLLWAIEALARTMAFSRIDEEYARVKDAIPVALSSMLSLQLSMEALMGEYRLNHLYGRREGNRSQLLIAEFESISVVLDSSITLLVRATKEDLSDFAFPPTYAERLQRYAARI